MFEKSASDYLRPLQYVVLTAMTNNNSQRTVSSQEACLLIKDIKLNYSNILCKFVNLNGSREISSDLFSDLMDAKKTHENNNISIAYDPFLHNFSNKSHISHLIMDLEII